ncbi:MAG TPA: exosortase E/protease, VPEID-CTERM system [Steroidobacteraceae bacterium]|nr:exosortase E/protease, VPEID-CTERM system [Steroidobacteraceae bacterium]
MSALEPISSPADAASALEKPARMTLAARAGLLALALFGEKFLLNGFVSFRAAQAARGLGTALRELQHFGFRFAVSFAIALTLFVYVRGDAALHAINDEVRGRPLRFRWLALHAVLLVPIAAALYNLYGTHGVHLPFVLLAVSITTLTTLSVAALFTALAPWDIWRRGAAAVGHRWLYAAAAALAATAAIVLSQELWVPTAQVTFELVRLVLQPLVPALQADPVTRVIYAPDFAVGIDPICSGLEGMGLILAFCAAWLTFFRAEYRFPRALLLIPAGVLIVFALNVIRIAALVLIGNAGHPAIAVFGFHSQAGWISFNAVACGLVFVSRRSRWLNAAAAGRMDSATATSTANATAAYMAPFLLVLAAGMISRASSGRFETWYALRLLAGGAVLAVYWPRLRALDWRFSWRAAAAGLAVFGLWLGASHLLLAQQGMPAALAAMSAPDRALWITSRVATAILVLPVAEELAYRGYLLRRLVAADFESVSFAAVGWIPVLVSALAYGILDGVLWPAGIAAGIVFAVLLTRTRRMGEAVAAHVVANALICAAVLLWHQWQLW